VKGHAGHAENERADALAREGIAAIRSGAIGALSSGELPAPKLPTPKPPAPKLPTPKRSPRKS
jgi:hypothetical protein